MGLKIHFIFWIIAILTIKSSSHSSLRNLISADNVCTFHIADKLFSLLLLQQVNPYSITIPSAPNKKISFNFCDAFYPKQCITDENINSTQLYAFAFLVQSYNHTSLNPTTNKQQTHERHNCTPYTSDSYTYFFETAYIKHNDEPQLILNLTNEDKTKAAEFHLFCSNQEYYKIQSSSLEKNNSKLVIEGDSVYGCPVFQISSLWTTLEEHEFLLGIIMFAVGFQMLFYGLLMINLTVFIAGYFISFAVLGGIFTVFLGPDSSSIAVYFSLLFILLSSTLIAYGLTKLINVSIFFIGAFFGIIVGALLNTIFCDIFSIASVWSLVFFQVIFAIPFGLLTLKYSNQVIIMSTSLTGSYLIIRPISWILGGFPNEFTLYQMYQTHELNNVPWSFYIYLLLIIILAIMGGFYQALKLQRQDPNNTIQTNIVTENIQQPLDKIKSAVDKIIARYSSSDGGQQKYKRMKQLQYQTDYFDDKVYPTTQYGNVETHGQRNSNKDNQVHNNNDNHTQKYEYEQIKRQSKKSNDPTKDKRKSRKSGQDEFY